MVYGSGGKCRRWQNEAGTTNAKVTNALVANRSRFFCCYHECRTGTLGFPWNHSDSKTRIVVSCVFSANEKIIISNERTRPNLDLSISCNTFECKHNLWKKFHSFGLRGKRWVTFWRKLFRNISAVFQFPMWFYNRVSFTQIWVSYLLGI